MNKFETTLRSHQVQSYLVSSGVCSSCFLKREARVNWLTAAAYLWCSRSTTDIKHFHAISMFFLQKSPRSMKIWANGSTISRSISVLSHIASAMTPDGNDLRMPLFQAGKGAGASSICDQIQRAISRKVGS